jgi:hypothetical protein
MSCSQCGQNFILCDGSHCIITGRTIDRRRPFEYQDDDHGDNRGDNSGYIVAMVFLFIIFHQFIMPIIILYGIWRFINYTHENGLRKSLTDLGNIVRRPFVIIMTIPTLLQNFVIRIKNATYNNRYYILLYIIIGIVAIYSARLFPPVTCTHWIRYRNGTVECLN